MAIWYGDAPTPEAMTAVGATSMSGALDIVFTAVGDDWVRASMPVDHRTMQPFGRLHGGASVVLAETAASVGGAMTVDPAAKAVVGMEINANHIRPASGGHVHALATAESVGRTTQVWTIRITDDADKLVCLSRITLAVIARG